MVVLRLGVEVVLMPVQVLCPVTTVLADVLELPRCQWCLTVKQFVGQ